MHCLKLNTYPGCKITSSYITFCLFESRHLSTCSYFFVNCFSTSLLDLRKINGWIVWGGGAEKTKRSPLNDCMKLKEGRQGVGQSQGRRTHSVQPDDQFVAIILVLLVGCFHREIQVGLGNAWDQEMDHGPQFHQGVVQRGINQEQPVSAVNRETSSAAGQ